MNKLVHFIVFGSQKSENERRVKQAWKSQLDVMMRSHLIRPALKVMTNFRELVAMDFIHVLFIVFSCFYAGHGSEAIRFDLTPSKCIAGMEKEIRISCRMTNQDVETSKDIKLFEILKDGNPLVFLYQCGNFSLKNDLDAKVQVKGHIDKGQGPSYLNLTLLDPSSEESGAYACNVYHSDKDGNLKMETAGGNLLVEKLDVKSLEEMLSQLKDKLSEVEARSGRQIEELNQKVSTLEKANAALPQQKTSAVIHNKGSDTVVAFSATNKRRFTAPAVRSTLIFPDVFIRIGTGYDEQTGVFTAPVAGLYAFHVVARSNKRCSFSSNLMANDKLLASLFSFDRDDWDQASISSVVDLKVGDRVYSTVRHGQCVLIEGKYSVFTGYLIKAF